MNSSVWILFIYGLIAGSLAIGTSLLLRTSFNTTFLPELASQTLFALAPGELESQAIDYLGSSAKYLSFFVAITINFIIYGALGIIINRFKKVENTKNIVKSIQSIVLSYLIFAGIAASLILLLQIKTGGNNIPLAFVMLSLIPPNIVFGFILVMLTKNNLENIKNGNLVSKNKLSDIDYDRRTFLRMLVFSAISLPLFFLGINRLFNGQQSEIQSSTLTTLLLNSTSNLKPVGFEDPILEELLKSEVTPTHLFYRIDISPVVPIVDALTWHLDIKGMVEHHFSINYDELKNMDSIQQYSTLQCISNKVGGDLISTALWRGVPLKDILSKAKVKQNVKYIVFRCSDGYDVGIPLRRGLMEGTILAYEMNLSPLTNSHGFPVRAIVPGLYGMMNPKWITEIELVDDIYEGYWQRNGWSNIAEINTLSTIVIPGQSPLKNRFRNIDKISTSQKQKNTIAGIAFAGDRGISKIEVSIDGGQTWKTAQIKDPLSKYTWVLWTAGNTYSDNKNYKIVVRATDKNGVVQTSEIRKPFPDGATGLHSIDI